MNLFILLAVFYGVQTECYGQFAVPKIDYLLSDRDQSVSQNLNILDIINTVDNGDSKKVLIRKKRLIPSDRQRPLMRNGGDILIQYQTLLNQGRDQTNTIISLTQVISDLKTQIVNDKKSRDDDKKVQIANFQNIIESINKQKLDAAQNKQKLEQSQQTGFNNLLGQVKDNKQLQETGTKNIISAVNILKTEVINSKSSFEQIQKKQFDTLQSSTAEQHKIILTITKKIDDLKTDVSNNKKMLEDNKKSTINDFKNVLNEITKLQTQADNIIKSTTQNINKKITNVSNDQQSTLNNLVNIITNQNNEENNNFHQVLNEFYEWKSIFEEKNNETLKQSLSQFKKLSSIVNQQMESLINLTEEINTLKEYIFKVKNFNQDRFNIIAEKINNLKPDDTGIKINIEKDLIQIVLASLIVFIAVMCLIICIVSCCICCKTKEKSTYDKYQHRSAMGEFEMRDSMMKTLPSAFPLE